MKRFKYSPFIFLSLAIGGTAHAQNADEARLQPQWQALDANRDGKVALDELHPMLTSVIGPHDGDGDGLISLPEYVAYDLDPGASASKPLPGNVRLVSDVPYAAGNDPRQKVDIYLPLKATVLGRLPVIAYVHGGAWRVGSKVMARGQVMELVDSGRYAAVSIGHRLSWQDTWPSQIHDVKAGIRWIRAHAAEYNLDRNRICAMGASAGGHLVAQLGATNGVPSAEGRVGADLRQSSNVHCVIDLFGPVDLRNSITVPGSGMSPVDQLLGGKPGDRPEIAADASPLLHVDRTDPPFLIIHGTKDPLVNYQDSVNLAKALRDAGVAVTFQTIEGGGHGDFGKARAEVERRIGAFLERTFYDKSVEVPADTLQR